MKRIVLLVTSLSLAGGVLAEDREPDFSIPTGMAGSYGTEQAEVRKVFSAEEDGARFRAYHVRWKDQDVIVSDMFGTTAFKEGDTISFMVQNIEVPAADKKMKLLQFMMIDISTFMPQPEEAKEPIATDEE